MALTKEQKREWNQLSEHFKKIEKISIENNIDLDVFMSDYKEGTFYIYGTEKITMSKRAQKRKAVFEKDANEKNINANKNQ